VLDSSVLISAFLKRFVIRLTHRLSQRRHPEPRSGVAIQLKEK